MGLFFLGLIIGCNVGFVVSALCVAASRRDSVLEKRTAG